jgi:hypothetical protein
MTQTIDWGLLNNQPRLYAEANQSVSSMRHGNPAARDAILDFVALRVSDFDIEQLLINMHVHERLVRAPRLREAFRGGRSLTRRYWPHPARGI